MPPQPKPLTRAELERAVIEAEAIVAELDRRAAEKSLIEFVRLMWPVVEPARKLVEGWALDAICEHLEAVARGEIPRLIMNVPPGFMKSLTTNVFFPAWLWGPCNRPTMRFLCAAYTSDLTMRDNGKFKAVIESDIYQRHWGERFGPKGPIYGTEKVENNKTGWKLASSVGGTGTGERADFVILDDPNNVLQAESKATRDTTNRWFREVMPTRLNDADKDSILIIQQRTHEDDVTGTALGLEQGYEHLCIAMEFDGRRCRTSIGWEDPRTEDNELAWPQRFPRRVVDRDKRSLGEYGTAAQFQQMPSPRGGGLIKREWWNLWGNPEDTEDPRYAAYPPFEHILVSVDTALTEKEQNDYSACTVWGIWRDTGQARVSWNGIDVDGFPQPKVMLMFAWRDRLTINALANRIARTAKTFKADRVVIEDKAAGHSATQELERLHGGNPWHVGLFDPKRYGDKTARLIAVSHFFENGLIYAPEKEWAEMVISEVGAFPKAAHDDLTDTVSQGLLRLRELGWLVRTDERDAEVDEAVRDQRPAMPLYPA
jgi:predicted phage terminase large subunit-like protein